MSAKNKSALSDTGRVAGQTLWPGQLESVHNLIQLLANTVQAARLFPPEHQTVVNFMVELHSRLSEYLDRFGELEIGVSEQSLTFAGKPVYEDPNPAKSLPFFFFKDGMQALIFCRGLTLDEVRGFLETIRQVAGRPPEEGDIVNALWEMDFANVRYLEPDDYLETKIGQGRPLPEWPVDRQAMQTGRIDLSPGDLEDIRNRIQAMGRDRNPAEASSGADLAAELGPPSACGREAAERQEIDSLLSADRGISSDDEYLSLIVEIMYLEDRADQLPGLAEIIKQYNRQLIGRRDFVRAARLLRSLLDLKEKITDSEPEKAAMLGAALGEIAGPAALAELEESLRQSGPEGEEPLVRYLRLIGAPAARLIGDLYERARSPAARELALQALKKIGEDSPDSLKPLVQESKPLLTRQIIALVSGGRDKGIVPFLAGFLTSRNVSVRLEAVRALGRAPQGSAARILLGFASDPENDVRIAALESLGRADPETVNLLVDHVGGAAGLRKKSLAEKRAVMSVLSRSQSEEACEWLRQVLANRPFWPVRGQTELCLCAVEALSAMSLPDAREALRIGSRKQRGKVRQACFMALQSLPKDMRSLGPGKSRAQD